MRRAEWLIIIIASILIIALGLAYLLARQKSTVSPVNMVSEGRNINLREGCDISEPISDSLARITKKPFGIFVEPGRSPVPNERFIGWHTGTDFEVFRSEADKRLPIYAICSGQLLMKKEAIGYGGVIVQSCTIAGQPVTVIYGHLNLEDKKTINLGLEISQREEIGSLAMAGRFTDNERRHLHLGIHKGESIDIRGYVERRDELVGWINYQELMK